MSLHVLMEMLSCEVHGKKIKLKSEVNLILYF